MKLLLVRHGETEWNKLGKFQGQHDIELNARGFAQAREAALAIEAMRPTAIYASPLCRTVQTAEEIARLSGLTVSLDDGFKELALGELEGVTGQEMREGWPQLYETWRVDPSAAVMPGGESLADLQQRAWQAFKNAEKAHGDDDVLVLVSHNFTIRAIFAKLLGMPLSNFHSMYLSLASICVVESGQWGLRLHSYNSVCHLSPDNQ